MLQGVLNQLLGGHIDDVILTPNNVSQLGVDPVHHNLGRLLSIELMGLPPDQTGQLSIRVLKLGGEQPLWERFDRIAPVGDQIGVFHHHLMRLLLSKIGKLLQHLVRSLEIDWQGLVGVLKPLRGQQDVPIYLVLWVQEVDVAGGADWFPQLLPQLDDGTVEVPQLLLSADHPLTKHEHIIADRLYLQIVIPGGNTLQLFPALPVHHGPEQLSRLAGRTDDKPLPILLDKRFGYDRDSLKVL